jgi:hypothetical protein
METCLRNGKPMKKPTGRPHAPVGPRFWEKVDKNGPTQPHMTTPCWLWTGATSKNGYGQLSVEGHQVSAHRTSWELHHGEIPEELLVLHHCDHRPCVRPDHLFLGTNKENSEDMVRKGRSTTGDRNASRRYPERQVRGSRQGSAKLTEAQVIAIREANRQGDSRRSLAQKYGVAIPTIDSIVTRRAWRHV